MVLSSFLTILAYLPVVNNGYVYEDGHMLPNQSVTGAMLFDTVQGMAVIAPRTLSTFSVWATAYVADLPAWHHTVSVIWHLVNGWLVWLVAASLLSPIGAAVAGAVFLVHPMNSQAVSYLAARPDLVATTGMLLTIWGAVRVRSTAALTVVVLLGTWLAVIGKESGIVTLPIALWVRWRQQQTVPWPVIGAGLVLAVLVAIPVLTYGELTDPNVMSRGPIGYALVQLTAAARYLSFLVWPKGFSVDHDVEAWSLLTVLIGSGLWIGAMWGAWRLRTSWPMLLTSVGFVVIAIGPRLVLRFSEYVHEHQVYGAVVGLCLLVGSLASRVES